MPTNITLYKIFLASPGDVKAERQIVKKVIDEINIGNYSNNAIKLELVAWKTHTHPSIGLDPQDVINRQIADDYDIFIGIMWNRFGTPTNRAESGTKEEFDRAFEKNKTTSTEVLFFFKTTPPLSLKDIDLESLSKVRKFQQELFDQGVYYREFNQAEEFEQLLRLSLISVLKEYKTDVPMVVSIQEEYLQAEVVEGPNLEDIGYFEALEITMKESVKLTEIYNRMTNNLTILSNNLNKKTEKIYLANALDQSSKMRELKKLINQLSGNMFAYCKKTREEISKLNYQQKLLIKYYYIVLTLHSSITDDLQEKQVLVSSLINLKETIIVVIEQIDGMRQSVIATPQMTTEYAKAKKETVSVLTDIINEFTANVNLLEELERSIQKDL
ncbi:DUF4062 domain-containing protein [Spirosoma validum]|uniref:DUF4062 domain-containing protein n=1 Tax=Spirosoma validum TaxID=2771355 RepID=A0A927B7J6_9BACT|nr:DUF4062 domain-containing protein [Spirosoma validum]MBD2756646.1 DUF4062 domain-containing protein [Spirosoma validum]